MVQQPQYHHAQYAVSQSGFQQQVPVTPQHAPPSQYPAQTPQMVSTPAPAQVQPTQAPAYATPAGVVNNDQVISSIEILHSSKFCDKSAECCIHL